MSYIIRKSLVCDSKSLVTLINQLRFQYSLSQINLAIKKYTTSQNRQIFVAIDENDKASGMITSYIPDLSFVPLKKCYVEALIIDRAYLNKEIIGAELLKAVEGYALERECNSIGLLSTNSTAVKDSHTFYINLGYIKDGPKGISYFYKSITKTCKKF